MKFVTYAELKNYGINFSRTHIGRLLKDPKYFDPSFPKPVPIGSHRVGFVEDEVLAWMEKRVAERDKRAAA